MDLILVFDLAAASKKERLLVRKPTFRNHSERELKWLSQKERFLLTDKPILDVEGK